MNIVMGGNEVIVTRSIRDDSASRVTALTPTELLARV